MLVFFGGGLGSLIRIYISPDSTEPFMWANIIACILAGHGYALTRYKVIQNEFLVAFYTIGFLGGLSTFTPLVMNSIQRAQEIHGILSIAYLFIDMVAYIILSSIFYYLTSLYLKKVKKLEPPKSLIIDFKKIKEMQELRNKQMELQAARNKNFENRSKKQKQRKAQQAAALKKNEEAKAQKKRQNKEAKAKKDALEKESLREAELANLQKAKEQAISVNDAEVNETIAEAGLKKEQEAAALQAHEEAKRAALEAYERVLKEKLVEMEKAKATDSNDATKSKDDSAKK